MNESADHLALAAPKPLHPASVLFQLLSLARQSLFPALLAGWTAVNGSMFATLFVAGLSGLAFVLALVRYFTLRYRISDGELVVTEGLIFRKVRTVPIDRIQNVDLVQNPLHRLLRVAEVRVETASGTKPEATLRVLSLQEVERLRGEIFSRSHRPRRSRLDAPTEDFSDSDNGENADEVIDRETILAIPMKWLVQAGIASNRGLILVGAALGWFFQANRRWDQEMERWADWFPGDDWMLNPWLAAPVVFLVILFLVRLLGVAWYVLRFSGYRLERVGEDLHLSCGLLTKVSATVPRRRIQFISIHRTPLMRWMKLASIRIETAGGSGKQGEDAAATVTRRWFVPVIPEANVASLIGQLRNELSMDEAAVRWKETSPRAGKRLLRISILASIIVASLTSIVVGPWGIAAGVISISVLSVWIHFYLRFLGYALFDDGVIFRSGVLTRKTSVTFFDRVQTVDLTSSFFDRRWAMAKLSVDTAAAGPADHAIRIPLLSIEEAREEFQTLVQRCAESEMAWN